MPGIYLIKTSFTGLSPGRAGYNQAHRPLSGLRAHAGEVSVICHFNRPPFPGHKRAWYNLFAHARDTRGYFPCTCS